MGAPAWAAAAAANARLTEMPGARYPLAVIATNVWRGVPFFAIMLLAGLQSVPDELYEAAHVDGAGVLARFWHITLPLVRPALTASMIS